MSILHFLAGTWFICSTSFPMWTTGKRTNPKFQYVIIEKKGEKVLYDEVTYIRNNNMRTIAGYDYPISESDSAFTWKGKGFLFFARSNWEIVLKDPADEWAVIHFSKTLFTPEGVDILFRTGTPDSLTLASVKQRMEQIPALKSHVPLLKDIR